jgi:hypothetical protein
MSRPPHDEPKRSASADAAFRAQLERLRAMTPRERMVLALTLRDRMAWVERLRKGAAGE